ncbi:MAG: MFS transporter [Candidatus Planktophila sp.]|nr:MFS transporter [Candidatus Planktophila sp.]MSO24945.1 MFS transporter [Candidatus Planktophila sp.]PHX69893.1 MAG: MFS transporter [Actinomycetota bacterium]
MLRIRWSGQITDGIFQSALASFVLFSPERQASAVNAAVAFAVVLLPYSVVGPFVGTLLDRFSRQRAIFFANLTRSLTLVVIALLIFNGRTGLEITIFVLVAFGVNRLILAGLSAGIPLMTTPKELISANALAVTGGSVWVVIGGGIGLGIRQLLDLSESADNADAVLILAAAFGYLIAALFTSLIGKGEIGPRPHEIVKGSFTQGLIEMREGFQFLQVHADAARGIAATAIHRGGLTALTLTALLLERNTFNDPADSEAGLTGLSVTLSIAATGFVIGALAAPYGVRKVGRHRWIRLSIFAASFGSLLLVIDRTPILLGATAFFAAMFGQSVKVTNDALVQSKIDDYFRGRVFSVYDVVVNSAIVTGALLAAWILPISGDSWLLPLIVSISWILVATVLLRPEKFFLKDDA